MEKKEKLELVIEQLEERIAPGGVGGPQGNNGFGNGGGDGVPGGSGGSQSPQTDSFNADEVR
jgi:hypothetical protein